MSERGTNDHSSGRANGSGAPACPICGREIERDGDAYPFCSSRCRWVDLSKWFSGGYSISRPVEEEDLDTDD